MHHENFFGHLKEEALRHLPIPTFQELEEIIDELYSLL
jgi:hypothetical protein